MTTFSTNEDVNGKSDRKNMYFFVPKRSNNGPRCTICEMWQCG